jgi:integrase
LRPRCYFGLTSAALPRVLTLDQVARLLEAAPGPGLKYKAALGIAYGAGLRGGEVVMLRVCAVERRRFPVGVSPTRQPLQPEATGAVMEVTKWLKPLVSVSRYTVTARVCRP